MKKHYAINNASQNFKNQDFACFEKNCLFFSKKQTDNKLPSYILPLYKASS